MEQYAGHAQVLLGGQLPAVADTPRDARPIFLQAADAVFYGFCCQLLGLSFVNKWYSWSMWGKIIAFSSVLAVVCLVVILQATTPATIGPLGILLVFILMYIAALGVLTFLIVGLQKVLSKTAAVIGHHKKPEPMSVMRAYYFASVMALAPVMIIGMQSVGEVGLYELSLVVVFLVIACVYIAKRTQ